MREKGMTSAELSEQTGLTKMTISNARRGKNITIINARVIAKALASSIEEIWPTEDSEQTEEAA
jgi:lambda repressor-like predicted transcriptional regulator